MCKLKADPYDSLPINNSEVYRKIDDKMFVNFFLFQTNIW